MKFNLNFNPPRLENSIDHQQQILLLGSCFTENIAMYFSKYKFNSLENPHGILYNPLSIATALESYIQEKQYSASDLIFHNGLWHSLDHHGKFSVPLAEKVLEKINSSQQKAAERMKTLEWLIISPGTAFVYEYPETGKIAGNCHKLPNSSFLKRLCEPEEIINRLREVFLRLFEINSKVKIIFTISPVRYIRDGLIENNLSKAVLFHATNKLIKECSNIQYFPSFELVIDDLRDYRFFKEDLVHPNDQAIKYVWEKFSNSCLSENSQQIIKKLDPIINALNHRPLFPQAEEHVQFREKILMQTLKLQEEYPYLNFSKEIALLSKV
jgi:hypothetical protein